MSKPRQRKRPRAATNIVVQSVAAFDIARQSGDPAVLDALTALVCAVALAHPEELAEATKETTDYLRADDRLHERAYRAVLFAVNIEDPEMRDAVDRMVNVVARKLPRRFLTAS